MKRTLITLEAIAERKNLIEAFHKAAKGKRYRGDVRAFVQAFDNNLNRLGTDIRDARLPYGKFRAFQIHDPKKRLIHAACFEDRIFHHALMNLAGGVLERAMMPSSYACRPNMGVHKAAVRANIRYMDDILWWCDSREVVEMTLQTVRHWLQQERGLQIKANVQIQPSKQGVTYCGFRILQGTIRLSRRRKRRYQQRRQYWEQLYLNGMIDANQLQLAHAAVHAITVGTDSLAWRQENLRRHPPISL